MSQKYEKLKTLLMELFQLDQPDLDFGLYRVMHAKSAEISQFLDSDLLPQVKEAFGEYRTADKAEIQKELAKVTAGIEAAGMDPEQSPKVKELRARLASDAVDIGALESEVYDHLFSFFRRYYSEGDFLAKRVYKQGVYAIPYEGEEVTLHWANKDQYYIKTDEYLRDYAFRLKPGEEKKPMRVHFRLVDVAEGEHGNVKAASGKERVFILAASGNTGSDFIIEEDGPRGKELAILFEYRPSILTDWPEEKRDSKKKPPVQKDLITHAVQRILDVADSGLVNWITELAKPHVTTNGDKADYPRLEGHLKRYTARNTFDYFIHKKLGAFLRLELDFFIKNEVMHLDDVENESVSRVEQYLSKIKVIRKIAGKIIDFLAQLEDFQIRLWQKKKFVVETNYCITLDRVPEDLFPEIAANNAQREEWVKLFAIDEITGDLSTPGYSDPMTVEFLNANDKLVLDTKFFGDEFKVRLLASLENIDEICDGIAIHSENYQALNLLTNKHASSIDTVYTDPPYNKRKDGDFAYKDSFQHSSWIAMIYDRLILANQLLKDNSCLFLSIDENEFNHLYFTGSYLAGFADSKVLPAITNLKGNQDTEGFASCHEYIVAFAKRSLADVGRLPIKEEILLEGWEEDDYGIYKQADGLRATGANAPRAKRPNLWYPIFFLPDGSDFYTTEENKPKDPSHIPVWPINDDGQELSWYWKKEKVNSEKHNLIIKLSRKGNYTLYKKQRPGLGDIPTSKPKSILYAPEYSSTHGGNLAQEMFNQRMSSFTPKSVRLIEDIVHLGQNAQFGTVLDFFAGSGTTAHAIINLNRKDNGKRKYILVEVGEYFNTVLMPRIKKAVYSKSWRNGKPSDRQTGMSHCFKYLRLESYEDAVNNLITRRAGKQQLLLDSSGAQGNDNLKEQYILHYMLDVETRGSKSLLDVQAFTDPTAYRMRVKHPGSDESREINVDLLETFNWLIGLTVRHIAAPQSFNADFQRDNEKRLRLKGRLKLEAEGPYWFRSVTGTMPDGRRVLVIWRKLTVEPEQDNLVLDAWFTKQGYSAKDSEFDLIYVNGGNNLANLRTPDDLWKVRIIEEDFHRLMFEMEGE
jgi:adenine-specific DNA-methyltransferase